MNRSVAERPVKKASLAPAAPRARTLSPLAVGASGDAQELEAERVAAQVVTGRARGPIGAAPAGTANLAPAPAAVARVLAGPGSALEGGVRRDMEQRFGQDFSAVRVHAGSGAAQSARELHAEAYTVDRDIVFGAGRFAPALPAGRELLAHELTHVVQQRGAASGQAPLLRRQSTPGVPAATPASTAPTAPAAAPAGPTDATKAEDVPFAWVWKDVTVLPLLKDIVSDIRQINMKPGDKKPLALKGTEGAALYPWAMGYGMGSSGFAGGDKPKDAGDLLSATYKYADALKGLTPAGDIAFDPFSRLFGMRVDDYLSSDLFLTRLKAHSAAIAVLVLAGQSANSLIAGLKSKNDDPSKLAGDPLTQHTALARMMIGAVLKKQMSAPDFFGMGPLQTPVHPAYSVSPFAGGGPPSGLTLERNVSADGRLREQKYGLTLNLPQLLKPGSATATDIADPAKYRGYQGSVWFSYDSSEPLTLTPDKQTGSKWKAGAIGGYGGHMGELETGRQYGGADGSALTSWFMRGGYGYAAADKETGIKKIGFSATYLNWTEQDVLAPTDASGAPAAGGALKLSPFAAVQFKGGSQHVFDANLALSFVIGSVGAAKRSGMADASLGLAYTYLGNTAPGALPAFKLELGGSVSRLDWWNPDSPLMYGAKVKGNVGRYFGGASVMTGAAGIDPARMDRIGPTVKAMVPTSVLFVGGVSF